MSFYLYDNLIFVISRKSLNLVPHHHRLNLEREFLCLKVRVFICGIEFQLILKVNLLWVRFVNDAWNTTRIWSEISYISLFCLVVFRLSSASTEIFKRITDNIINYKNLVESNCGELYIRVEHSNLRFMSKIICFKL